MQTQNTQLLDVLTCEGAVMQRMNLVSPKGTVIIATLERLSGRAVIAPGSARKGPLGDFEFNYEGSTDIFWEEQKTVQREGEGEPERVFVDEEGTEFLESELKLAPGGVEGEPTRAKAGNFIIVTIEGGVVQDIVGIPPGVIIHILDFDTEGADEKSLTVLPNGSKACVSEWQATASPTPSEDTT